MAGKVEREVLDVAGRQVAISNPRKVLFPQRGYTKLDLARYYVAVADGALHAAGGRPNVLVRYPDGIGGEFFYQKRALQSRPDWIEVIALRFPSGRSAEESCRAMRRRWCGWPTSRVSSCTPILCGPTISRIPTSCASISIPCPARPSISGCRGRQPAERTHVGVRQATAEPHPETSALLESLMAEKGIPLSSAR